MEFLIGVESAIGLIFITAATTGFKSSLWIVAAALAAHGVYDFTHEMFFTNPGAPGFWPEFCSGYDITAAVYLGSLIRSNRLHAAAPIRAVTP